MSYNFSLRLYEVLTIGCPPGPPVESFSIAPFSYTKLLCVHKTILFYIGIAGRYIEKIQLYKYKYITMFIVFLLNPILRFKC